MERQVYHDAMYCLEMADYKKDRRTDIIDIGTKFSIRFDGETEEDEFILIEGIDGISSKNGFVSLNSLLGQSIIGKPEGAKFAYDVITGTMPWDKNHVSGVITSIKKDPKDYTNFIRDKDKRERIGKKYKNRRHELLIADTPEAIEELESYQAISASQRLLLLIEAERLTRKTDRSAINRMTVVKNY